MIGPKYNKIMQPFCMIDGKIPFWQAHLTRLENSSRILAFKLNGYSSKENLHQACLTLAQKNNIGKNARLRLQVFRAAGGLYTPTNNNTEIIITLKPLNNNNFVWQKKGLTLGVYQNMVKQYNLDDIICINETSLNSFMISTPGNS